MKKKENEQFDFHREILKNDSLFLNLNSMILLFNFNGNGESFDDKQKRNSLKFFPIF